MGIFSCDRKGCERKPYMELVKPTEDGQDIGSWCYVCFWHYLEARMKALFDKTLSFAYCKVDTDREAIEHLRYELWDIQSDIYEIKKSLGIEQSEEMKEIERNLDVT